MRPGLLRHILNLWPPFLFSGIRVQEIAPDWSRARVRLKLAWYNRNYVRTHYGGNLFSMTDPFWMLLLMHQLGRDYLVWDQAGEIHFVTPGREDVYARFDLEPDLIDTIRTAAADGQKYLHWFNVDITTADGTVIARVRKQLYIRLRPHKRPSTTPPA